jgi:HK97 family phage major capsid protein
MASMYHKLLQERTDLVAEGGAMFEAAEKAGRELTAAEKSRDDEINARLAVVNADLEREEARRERERTAQALPTSGISGVRDLAAERPFASMGEQLQAVAAAVRGVVDPRLMTINAVALGNNVSVPSDGGFFLQPAYSQGLYQRSYELGQILNRCMKVPIGDQNDSVKINGMDEDSRATGSRWGGVRAYWVAEAGTLTASQPHFKQIELAPKKLIVLVYATSEMLRNGAALEAVVNRVVPQEITFMSEDAIFRGDGAGKPEGFLVSPAFISVAVEAGQAAATIVAENISKMWARMWAASRANAIWLYNQEAEPQLDALNVAVGTGGALVYMPAGGLADTPYGRMKGRPTVPVEYCSPLGTLGDIVLCDPNQYAISDRGGVQAASSIHVQFLTDQTAFRFTYEIDGESLWSAPLTPYQATAGKTLGPFVGLETRS